MVNIFDRTASRAVTSAKKVAGYSIEVNTLFGNVFDEHFNRASSRIGEVLEKYLNIGADEHPALWEEVQSIYVLYWKLHAENSAQPTKISRRRVAAISNKAKKLLKEFQEFLIEYPEVAKDWQRLARYRSGTRNIKRRVEAALGQLIQPPDELLPNNKRNPKVFPPVPAGKRGPRVNSHLHESAPRLASLWEKYTGERFTYYSQRTGKSRSISALNEATEFCHALLKAFDNTLRHEEIETAFKRLRRKPN